MAMTLKAQKSNYPNGSVTVFLDCNGVVHHEFLPQCRTVNKEYYLKVMRRLREAIHQKQNDKTTKLILYKTLILPVFLYGPEAWTLLSTDAAALRVFERKIFGPVRVGDDFRIRVNSELYEHLTDMDVVQRINNQRLRWLGHVVRMEKDAPARRVFDAGICGSRQRGRSCIRRKDQIEEALSSIGVTNWHRRAKSRSAWKDVLRQAEIR